MKTDPHPPGSGPKPPRRRATDTYRIAVEAAPNAMMLVAPGGKIFWINAQAERLFGYSRDELVGQSINMFVPERFRQKHSEQCSEFFLHPQVRTMGTGRDLWGLRKDGSEMPVEIGLNPSASLLEYAACLGIPDFDASALQYLKRGIMDSFNIGLREGRERPCFEAAGRDWSLSNPLVRPTAAANHSLLPAKCFPRGPRMIAGTLRLTCRSVDEQMPRLWRAQHCAHFMAGC